MGKCIIGNHSITCYRGSGYTVKRISLQDKQGNIWYSALEKNEFEKLPENYPVDVCDETGKINKRFIKSYLKFLALRKKKLRFSYL